MYPSFHSSSSSTSPFSSSLDMNRIPSFSQIMGGTPVTPPTSSVAVSAPPGMINIYMNIANVFFSISQDFQSIHKSFRFDYYVSSCRNWLDGLSNESNAMALSYPQFIPMHSQAFWSPVPDMLEVEFFSSVSKQLYTIIHSNWSDLREIVPQLSSKIFSFMDVLNTCITGVSTNGPFQRACESLPVQFQHDEPLTSSLRLYLLCTQFVCDLRSSSFSYLYPSLYLWDAQNGVQHLQQQLWMEITQRMDNTPISNFITRMQALSAEIAHTRVFLQGGTDGSDDCLALFDARFRSFFDAALAEAAGNRRFELESARMRFVSASEEAKRENWEKQRSILRVLTQIRENYAMAMQAKQNKKKVDVEYIVEHSMELLKTLRDYEQVNHLKMDSQFQYYRNQFRSLLE